MQRGKVQLTRRFHFSGVVISENLARPTASITTLAKGSIFDPGARSKAFESAAKTLIDALERDKDLLITDTRR